MLRRPNRTASLALLVAMLAATALAIGPTGPSTHSELDTLGRQAFRALWDFHPVDATRCGYHEFDGRLGDYSPARLAALKLQMARFSRSSMAWTRSGSRSTTALTANCSARI
jgi:hypothetical protein